jgi:hypothetical protein
MLTEPPGEALVRTSTYRLPSERPDWIDLTTVYEQPLALTTEQSKLTDLTNVKEKSPDPLSKVELRSPKETSNLWGNSASATVFGHALFTKAIYAIESDQMTYCVAPPGKPRPSGFVTKKGDGYTLVSLKRWSDSK